MLLDLSNIPNVAGVRIYGSGYVDDQLMGTYILEVNSQEWPEVVVFTLDTDTNVWETAKNPLPLHKYVLNLFISMFYFVNIKPF